MAGNRKTGPTPLGKVLATSAELAPDKGRIDADLWRRLVGERVAERTRVGATRNGVLTIHAVSSVWAQELSFLAPTILERLAAAGLPVKELRFRVGELGEPAPRGARAAAPKPEKLPLPPELAQRIKRLDDPLLRAAITEAAAYSLARSAAATSTHRATRAPRSAASGTDRQGRDPAPRLGEPRRTGGKRPR